MTPVQKVQPIGESAAQAQVGIPALPEKLTPRQIQIMQLICLGYPDYRTAAVLGITPRGVRHHVAEVCLLFGVFNRAAAAYRFAKIEPELLPKPSVEPIKNPASNEA